MDVDRPEFRPDPSLCHDEMERLQSEIAAAAVFQDALGFDPGDVGVDEAVTPKNADREERPLDGGEAAPVVAGVDQAFRDGEAVSAVVVLRGDDVVERAHAVESVEIPYIPGLLSFREGGAILSALSGLDSEPDLLMVDGSGRVHFREAGLATHVGVAVDTPAIGVAKRLLCSEPRQSLEDPLPEGRCVPIEADGDVTAPAGTTIGHAVQTRQFDSDSRYVNPVYASPGHRVSAPTAADLVMRCAAGYKLPEPTRLADSHADAVKRGSTD